VRLETLKTPFWSPNSELLGIVGISRDVSDRVAAADELRVARQQAEEAAALKSMFLANMSHEIRTPLNAIIGLTHLALKTPLEAKLSDTLQKIHQAGTSLLSIVNAVLDFSDLEAGKLEVQRVPFRLDDVIQSVLALTRHQAEDKNLGLFVEPSPTIPAHLVGDPVRLGQVLTNLLHNAIKFTERGQVHLTAELLGTNNDLLEIRFAVNDTGIGMSQDQIARLFQPFTQADMSSTRKHGGTGLSLAICQHLVERMGGSIGIVSEPGRGSTVSFTCQLERGSEHACEPTPVQLQGARILVVEDNEINQQIAAELLEGVGASVTLAADGQIALDLLNSRPQDYDLILMDLQMPEMDGYQATARIRAQERFAGLPIVALTAHATAEERQRCLDSGMNDHLSKPIDPGALFKTLSAYFTASAALPEARPQSPADPDELPPVEGLDSYDGVLRVGGNRSLYLKLLRQFMSRQSDAPEQIDRQLQAGDWATAERTAHSLKGVAGNLGAKGVQAAAADLEQALRQGMSLEEVQRLRQILSDQLNTLITRLRPALGEPSLEEAPSSPVDPQQMKPVTTQLLQQLSDFDVSAQETVEKHRALLSGLFSSEIFEQFQLHLQNYAFGEAQAVLEEALRTKGQSQ
jgi:signal transduction histidine kinase/CheY-like chemotaxis protein